MRQLIKLASNLIERLSWLASALSGLILCLVIFLVVYGVILRYVFRNPAAWSIELPSFLFMAILAGGLAYVHRMRGHIGVELLVIHFSERKQRVFAILGSIMIMIYAGFIAWGGWQKAFDHLHHGEHSAAAGIPLFAVQIVLPIGLFLLILQALVEIGKDVARVRAKRAITDGEKTTVSERG